MKYILTCFAVSICLVSYSQCLFESNEYDRSDNIPRVESEFQTIYHEAEKERIQIGVGNIGFQEDFILFKLSLKIFSWSITPKHQISFVFADDTEISINSDAKVYSKKSSSASDGIPEIGVIKLILSEQDLGAFQKKEISQINVKLREGNRKYKIDTENSGIIKHLIDCTTKEVNVLSKKMNTEGISYNKSQFADWKKKEMATKKVVKQEPVPDPTLDTNQTYSVVEQMPRFPGCEDEFGDTKMKEDCAKQKMLEFIYKNLKYPPDARKNRVEGMCVVQYVIDKDGSVTNIKLARDIGAGCGEAAIDVVKLMNKIEKWTPGTQRGKNVKVLYTLPVRFKLEG